MGAQFRLQLADPDRERYGAPEWLDVDVFAVTAWEAALIQRGFTRDGLHIGFDSPAVWARALPGEVVTGDNGEPIMVPLVGDDGEPIVVPQRRPDLGAELILVWLALRHAGIQVPMDQIDYHVAGMRWEPIVDEEPPDPGEVPGESEGKGDAGSPAEPGSIPISAG